MHNTLRKDRYTSTNFQKELQMLGVKDNGAYTLGLPSGCQVVAERLPQVSKVELSKDKNRVEEDRIEDSVVEDSDNHTDDDLSQFYGDVYLSENQIKDLLDRLGLQVFDEYVLRLDGFIKKTGAKIKSHYNEIIKWAKEDGRI
jgi:hypothetical protein